MSRNVCHRATFCSEQKPEEEEQQRSSEKDTHKNY